MGFFFRRSRAANSAVHDPIWLNFEISPDFMLLTCKNEEDSIKNEGAKVFTTLYIDFFKRSRAANSVVSGGILPIFSHSSFYACPCYLQE